MEFVYDDKKTTQRQIAPMCLNLPTAINYANLGDCGNEYNDEEWDALNFGGNNPNAILTSGHYRIFMRSQVGTDSARQLCFLKKID